MCYFSLTAAGRVVAGEFPDVCPPFCRRRPFGLQKVAFCVAICRLLQDERRPFATLSASGCQSICYALAFDWRKNTMPTGRKSDIFQ